MADDPLGYTRTARILHWISALVVLSMIPVGLVMVQDGLPRSVQNALFLFHKNVGVAALILAVVRLGWRIHAGSPGHDALPAWQRRAASTSHAALYVLIFVLPVSGYIRVRAGGFPVETLDALGVPPLVPRSDWLEGAAQAVHYWSGWVLMAVLAAHFGAAALHGLILRDAVWQRIWPPFGGRG